jgi:FkbM family methyltransferase
MLLRSREDAVTAWIIWLRKEYVVRPSDRTILDCGANIGAFALYAAEISPAARIVAVEPFPETFSHLTGNIAMNSRTIETLQVALAGHHGAVNMYAAPEVPSQARQVIEPSGDDTVSVPALTLASLLERVRLESVDLVKMDIEGSEHAALLAADPGTLRQIGRLALEYHQTGSKATLFAHLLSSGFQLSSDRILGRNYGVAEFSRS